MIIATCAASAGGAGTPPACAWQQDDDGAIRPGHRGAAARCRGVTRCGPKPRKRRASLGSGSGSALATPPSPAREPGLTSLWRRRTARIGASAARESRSRDEAGNARGRREPHSSLLAPLRVTPRGGDHARMLEVARHDVSVNQVIHASRRAVEERRRPEVEGDGDGVPALGLQPDAK